MRDRPPPLTARYRPASKAQIALASVMLVGVVVMGYGFYQDHERALFSGLVIIAAGVLGGVVHIVRRAPR